MLLLRHVDAGLWHHVELECKVGGWLRSGVGGRSMVMWVLVWHYHHFVVSQKMTRANAAAVALPGNILDEVES
jgi:hypothetical protein